MARKNNPSAILSLYDLMPADRNTFLSEHVNTSDAINDLRVYRKLRKPLTQCLSQGCYGPVICSLPPSHLFVNMI